MNAEDQSPEHRLSRAQEIAAELARGEDISHEMHVQRCIEWADEQLRSACRGDDHMSIWYTHDDGTIRTEYEHDRGGTLMTVRRPYPPGRDGETIVKGRGDDLLREPIEIVEHVQTIIERPILAVHRPWTEEMDQSPGHRLSRAGITIDVQRGKVDVSADLDTFEGILDRRTPQDVQLAADVLAVIDRHRARGEEAR